MDEETIIQPERTPKNFLKSALPYAVLMAALLVLFKCILMLNLIPSGSMENTLMTGSFVISNRLDCKNIDRYDIMVFRSPEIGREKEYYIKRVIGLPGEKVTIVNGKVYAGTELTDSAFLPEPMKDSGISVYQVPEGCYFMMGDNRNHSSDARFWDNPEGYRCQYIPREDMTAKAILTIWPLNKTGSLRHQSPETSLEDDPRRDCPLCGGTACMVEGEKLGHVEINGGQPGWVTDGHALYCLLCEETVSNYADGGVIVGEATEGLEAG